MNWEERKVFWTVERKDVYRQTQLCPGTDPDLVKVVIDRLEKWFQWLETGAANRKRPSPLLPRYTKEVVDRFIAKIDERFEFDLVDHPAYWKDTMNGIDYPPEFDRLKGGAREAFMQDVLETTNEIVKKRT